MFSIVRLMIQLSRLNIYTAEVIKLFYDVNTRERVRRNNFITLCTNDKQPFIHLHMSDTHVYVYTSYSCLFCTILHSTYNKHIFI